LNFEWDADQQARRDEIQAFLRENVTEALRHERRTIR
jgi:hypothetical protein